MDWNWKTRTPYPKTIRTTEGPQETAMAVSANRLELLQIADAVARDVSAAARPIASLVAGTANNVVVVGNISR